jgi:hypothetical protein
MSHAVLLFFADTDLQLAAERREAAAAAAVEPLAAKLQQLLDLLHVSKDTSSPIQTPAHLGTSAMEDLARPGDRRMVTFAASAGAAVFDEGARATAVAFTDEQLFDVFMTPHLARLFPNRTVVNSENYQWLQTHANKRSLDQKPDFFVCNASFYAPRIPGVDTTKGATLDDARNVQGGEFRFGVPADWKLRDAIVIISSKMKLRPSALGEVLSWHQWLGGDKPRRALLFDTKKFQLIESDGRVVTQVVEGEWTAGGSLAYIQDFFPLSPWDAIEQVCSGLGVSAADPLSGGVSGFLGAGGSGRVISVLDKSDTRTRRGTPLALKVVLAENADSIRYEFDRLKQHADACTCQLLARPASTLFVDGPLHGYTMTPLGVAVNREMLRAGSFPSTAEVFDALVALHAHKPRPIIHGDARLANLLVVDGTRLVWIDMMTSNLGDDASGVQLQRDVSCLVGSVAPALCNTPALVAAVAAYPADGVTTIVGLCNAQCT